MADPEWASTMGGIRPPAQPDTSIISQNPARSRQPESREERCVYLMDVFCFIRMVGGLICDECECIECVIRQMFSFPDHSACLGSLWLWFSIPNDISLFTFSQMPFHPRKWNASSQSSFQPFSPHRPLLQACDLICWTIDGNLALFQWLPPSPLRVEAGVWPWPDPATQTPGLRASRDARDKICIIYTS